MNFIRICPDCKKEISHTTPSNRNHADKLKLPCVHCGRLRMMNVPGYWEQVERTKKILRQKLGGKNNPNYGKPMSEQQKAKIRKNAKILRGKDNLSYGKSVYQWWIEKYGVDVANKKMEETKLKWSKSSSGKRNPMYGKPAPHGSGNGWSGWYKGWYFRSIHELSYMINIIEPSGLQWESAEQKKYAVPYTDWKGDNHIYFADFIINNNKMIECKPTRLHQTPSVKSKQEGAIKLCDRIGLTYSIECPILLTDDEVKKLYRDEKIKFIPRYEKLFLEKYGKA